MYLLSKSEVSFIREYVDEIMALYEADEEAIFPIKIEEMSKTIYEILNAKQNTTA